jgi:hypothetical protein
MQTSASDRKDIRRAEKDAKLQATQDAETICKIVMGDPFGRAWMWRLLSQAHIFEPNLIPDIRLSSIWDGERNFGLRLLADIMLHCPELYLQMTREANDRHNSDDRNARRTSIDNANPTSERRGGPQSDGGDSGPLDGSAEGPITGDPSTEGWNLAPTD